jgi:hypothetical protein
VEQFGAWGWRNSHIEDLDSGAARLGTTVRREQELL